MTAAGKQTVTGPVFTGIITGFLSFYNVEARGSAQPSASVDPVPALIMNKLLLRFLTTLEIHHG